MSKKRAQAKEARKPSSQKQSTANKSETKKEKEQKFSLYSLLQLENGPKSTIDEIKKQYKKLVIVCHPDKNLGDDSAKQKFQKLKQAYDILCDPQKKQIYDQTGKIGDDFDEKTFETAYEYYRKMYRKIQKQDIEQFAKKYKNGPQEKQDLIEFYETHKGNMTLLLQSIPLSQNEDIPRFISFFEQIIENKTLKKYNIFQKTKNNVKLLVDESEQFEIENKKKEQQFSNLILAIKSKKDKSFLEQLEQKYAPKKQKVEKKTQVKQESKRQKRKKQ